MGQISLGIFSPEQSFRGGLIGRLRVKNLSSNVGGGKQRTKHVKNQFGLSNFTTTKTLTMRSS